MKKLALGLSALALACTAQAADLTLPSSGYMALGTQGIGAGVILNAHPDVDVRVGASFLGFSKDFNDESSKGTASLKLQNISIVGDYFPSDTGFRLTGGVQFGKNALDIKLSPTSDDTITVGGKTYGITTNDSVSGRIDMGNLAPYAGIGYSSRVKDSGGWGFLADLGLRAVNTKVKFSRSAFDNLPQAEKDKLDASLRQEEADAQEDAKKLKVYPVLSLGVIYRW